MKPFIPILAFATLLATRAAAAADPITYLQLPFGLTHTLVLEEDGASTSRIPVMSAPSGPAFESLEPPTIFDVQFRDGRSNAVANDFEAALQAADGRRDRSLLIRTRPDSAALRPGAYTVIVHVAPKNAKDKVQSIALVLQKPAPTLGLGSTVVIRRTRSLVGLAFGATEDGELQLREDSRNANVSKVELRTVVDQTETSPTAGALQLPPGPFSIKAGTLYRAPVSPAKPFPIGTSKGRIEVVTPDLTNVSSINYEVRTREHPGLIVLIAAFGAFFGWLVRVHLKRRQERGAASIKASTAMEALRETQNRIEDGRYRARLDTLRRNLEAASTASDPAAILLGANDATEKLKALEAELDAERTKEIEAASSIGTVLLRGWVLPSSAQTALEQARAALGGVSASLARNNIEEARVRRAVLIDTALLNLMNEALGWRVNVARYFEALAEHPPAQSDPERENLRKVAAKLAQNLPQTPNVAVTTIAAVEPELNAVHGLLFTARDSIDHLRKASAEFLEWAMDTLTPVAVSLPKSAVERLTLLTRSIVDAFESDLSAPKLRLDEPRQRSRLLREGWMTLLRAHVPAADPKKVEELMSAGQWAKAVIEAATVSAKVGTALDRRPSASVQRAIAEPPGALRSVAEGAPPDRAQDVGFPVQGTPQERKRLSEQIASASFWQSVFVGVLFVVGVYLLHVDAWVGTPKEIMTLLMLAFVTDFTADSVVNALR
jgi:hypothetical protein